MLFWLLAITITAIACAALYFAAAGRTVRAGMDTGANATDEHYRLQLAEINADIAAGRLGEAEGTAARAELARELIRLQGEDGAKKGLTSNPILAPLAVLGIAIIAFGSYGLLGNPGLPGQPLATRERPLEERIDVNDAVKRIEAQLEKTPDDVRGWTVIAPVYMQMGRYEDAVTALRHVNELAPPTADTQTDLAEAMLMVSKGEMTPEAQALLENAVKLDPKHVRSRFYLAGAATQSGDYAGAVVQWNELIGMAAGNEPWIAAAKEGLAAAQNGVDGKPAVAPEAATGDAMTDDTIKSMVEGLSDHLLANGGTIEEWTRLVRSRLVLGQTDAAQAAYDAAKAAYPDAAQRTELDATAAQGGLK